MKVKFSAVMDAIELASDDIRYYYNVDTQEVISVALYDDDNDIEMQHDHYISLPSKYDINDYQIMEDFIQNLPDEQQSNQLAYAIHGRGAFRSFRNLIDELNLTQQWYDFRTEAYEQIARQWCQENLLES